MRRAASHGSFDATFVDRLLLEGAASSCSPDGTEALTDGALNGLSSPLSPRATAPGKG